MGTRGRRLSALAPLVLGILLRTGQAVAAECDVDLLCQPTDDPCVVSGSHSLTADCTLGFGNRQVSVTGTLKAPTTGGKITILSGPFTLDGGAIHAHGDTGYFGGTITITANGPFVMDPAGPLIEADGANGGGSITVTADAIDLRAGTISADGTSGAADGGAVSLTATGTATVAVAAAITVQGRGSADSGGGNVTIDGAAIDVQATINTAGGGSDGGDILLMAAAGDVTLESSALLLARAGSSDASGGSGGAIEIDAAGSIVVGAPVRSEGPGPDGFGGDITLSAGGSIEVDDTVTCQGTGTESDSGSITLEAGGGVVVSATLDASSSGGDGSGGDVSIDASGDVTVAAGVALDATGGSSGAGTITVVSRSTADVAGVLDVTASNGGPGGLVTLSGCSLTVDGTLDAHASGTATAGWNRLVASTVTIGADAVLLSIPPPTPDDGFASGNGLTLRAGLPTIVPGAVVDPDLEVHVDPTITPCCGNGRIDPGELCDDGNMLYCDGCGGTCLPEPPCPDDGNPCTLDCNPDTGCTYDVLDGVPCPSDGNVCTTDVCVTGTCTHATTDCDDGVACTLDACDPVLGCVSVPTPALCDDGNPCTDDLCTVPGGCTNVARPDATPCDDGDVCTRDDACVGGHCVGTGIALSCDDGNPCTVDFCDPNLGCIQREDATACGCMAGTTPLPAGTPCADGVDCTTPDTCDGAGHCVGGPVCDDGDPCTTDVCFLECLHLDDACPASCAGRPDGTACSDGDVCTVGTCQGGTCVETPRDCGDEDACDGVDLCLPNLECRPSFPPNDPRCFAIPLDTFGCYKAHTASGTPRFTPVTGLDVVGGFDAFATDVAKVARFCLPASWAGTNPLAPLHEDHLTSYKTHASPGAPPFTITRGLTLQNQLGTIALDAVARSGLLVPATMSLGPPPGDPVPPDPDDFFCYKVRPSAGSSFVPAHAVLVTDQFGDATLDLVKPTRVCTPVDLEGEAPDAPTHATVLVCYKAKSTTSGSFLPRVVGVNDRFPAQTLYLSKREEVCLPSVRLP